MRKTTIWILGDQLLENHPALPSVETAENVTILMIESQQRTQEMPYQRKRLVLLLSAMRHYAIELQQQGYEVDYVNANTFLEGVQQHVSQHKPESASKTVFLVRHRSPDRHHPCFDRPC